MSTILLSYLFKTQLSAFRSAISHNDTNQICRILDIDRTYINKQLDANGNTALLLAIKYASPLTLQLLLEQGAQPDQSNYITQQTPLSILASTFYHNDHQHQMKTILDMTTILLDYGAYVDKPSLFTLKDQYDQEYIAKETPLMTAVRMKNLSMVTLLMKRKANVNYMEKQSECRW